MVYPGDLHAFSLRQSFSLAFDDEGDLWGFMFSLAEAKTANFNRMSDLVDRFRRVLTTVPTVRASPQAVAPTTVDAAVATDVAED